jgi:hypothetical protein
MPAKTKTCTRCKRRRKVVLDFASAFGSTNGDAPPTVLYGAAKAHSSGRSHQTPGGYVRGAG